MLAEQSSLTAILTFFAWGTCLVICLTAEAIGTRLRVMDIPDNKRKHHSRATPLVGGIAILAAAAVWLVTSSLVAHMPPKELALTFLLPMSGAGLVGFTDDQSPLSPIPRMLFLLLLLSVAFALDPALISRALNWGTFAPTAIPAFSFCVLMGLACVGVVNAVNMADGQNGIVPGMFVIWSACLTLVGDPATSALAQILLGASFIVLIFNLLGRLFLGDCGSYGVTFVLGLATILSYAEGKVSIETITVWFFIPVVDCLRLMITRRMKGRSPMEADHDHFHHRLQDEFGPRYGLVAYVGVVGLTSLIAATQPHLALLCMIVLTAFYCSFAGLAESPPAVQTAPDPEEESHAAADNVISLPAQEGVRERLSGTGQ